MEPSLEGVIRRGTRAPEADKTTLRADRRGHGAPLYRHWERENIWPIQGHGYAPGHISLPSLTTATSQGSRGAPTLDTPGGW